MSHDTALMIRSLLQYYQANSELIQAVHLATKELNHTEFLTVASDLNEKFLEAAHEAYDMHIAGLIEEPYHLDIYSRLCGYALGDLKEETETVANAKHILNEHYKYGDIPPNPYLYDLDSRQAFQYLLGAAGYYCSL